MRHCRTVPTGAVSATSITPVGPSTESVMLTIGNRSGRNLSPRSIASRTVDALIRP